MSRIVQNVNNLLWIIVIEVGVFIPTHVCAFPRAIRFRPARGTEHGAAPVQSVLVGSR